MSNFHKVIVPGLDVLIGDPGFLVPSKDARPKAEILYIPSYYIYRTLDFYNEQSNRGEAARELTAIFGTISEAMNRSYNNVFTFENGMQLKFMDSPENPTFRGSPQSLHIEEGGSKFHAIAIARVLQEERGYNDVAIMTGSDQLATPAAFNRIDVARLNPEVYTGRTKVLFPEDHASLWWTNHCVPKHIWDELFPNKPLKMNQYVELFFDAHGQVDASFQNIGRFNGEAVVPLRSVRIKDPRFHRIRPKTPGQAMLFDALLAPVDEISIVIVPGIFGTGKTFCTVAAGLSQVMAGQYDEIFVCPRDGALGREIGFLKGDKLDKILPQVAPIMDSLEAIVRLTDDKLDDEASDSESGKRKKRASTTGSSRMTLKKAVEQYRDEYFEFEPIIFMGGRSIGNAYMIYDEFQDMERWQARELLTRIGNHSKIIVAGDPTQTSNPHLNHTSNGLSYSASKLAGDELAAVISFDKSDEIVRSPAARHIAERMSSY